jgi:hypothetical protein
MEDYTYIKNNAIDDELCDELINFFEIYKNDRKEGVVVGGVRKDIKDTTDIGLYSEHKNDFISKSYKLIHDTLFENVNKWNEQLMKKNKNQNVHIQFINSNLFLKQSIILQKYNRESGFYIYHNDFSIAKKNVYRVITFIFYLNNVKKGGETEFFGEHKITPERGKLLLFPASWTFPHRGITPISDDKYILTGWLYTTINSEDK